jgi:hypothetical protein
MMSINLHTLQVPGWKVGESVYINKRWVPPAQPVGAWGE